MINDIKNKLKEFMGEEWVGLVKSDWQADDTVTDVYKNPSRLELAKLVKHGENPQRFIIDLEGNVYFWNANDALHDEVRDQLKIPYSVKGAYFNPKYVEFFKTKVREFLYDKVRDSKLMDLLDPDVKDNLGSGLMNVTIS